MTKRTHKNFVSLLLIIFFFVAEFNISASKASAAIYPSITPSQISIDLSEWLLNGAAYSVDIPPADLARVMAIPSDLYEPAHQWQADKITANIENDPIVNNRTKGVSDAKVACDGDLDCASGLLLTADGKNLQKAIDNAMDALVTSLASARAAQDPTIEAYQIQNKADEALNDRYSTYSEIASSSDAGISAINEIDIGNASRAPEITQEQIEASRLAQQSASAWNTDDTIALKMQQDCSVIKGRLMPCFAEAVYKIIYKPTAYALMGAGYIFDQILSLSIEGAMVAPPFIDSTWKVVRDFSNMIFIFILLYAGVETILGGKNWMKTIRLVIIIALLINFSLFFTKVVIDAGNVLAVGVKSAISTTSVSEGLAAAFQPQQFLSAATKGPDTSGGDAIIVFLVAAVVSGFAAYIFFKAALLFMGRLIAFWGLMIISPYAFISMAMPPKVSIFDKWLNTLVSQSFVAPVFLFFVYIIMKVVSGGTGILDNFTHTQGDWFKELLGPVIVATLLILALQKALEIATDMSGEFGRGTSNLISKPLGLAGTVALGAATGGAALVAQKTIGRAAMAAAGSDKFKAFAAKSPLGRVAYSLTDRTANATFDVRNAPMGDKLGLGKGGSGSFVKTVEETKKADVEFGKKVMYDKEGKLIPGAAESYAKQLEKGYITRAGTGGNIGAQQAAKETTKTVEKEEKKKRQKEERLSNLEAKKLELQEKYGDLLSRALQNPDIYEDAHNSASAELRAAEKAVDMAEEGTDANAKIAAKTRYARALAGKKTSEKELNMYNTGKAELSKIHKDIEDMNE